MEAGKGSNLYEYPKQIKIGEYNYSFKTRLINNRYSYRCRNRKCGVLITIDETNLKKLEEKKDSRFDYQTNNKEHTCDKPNISTDIKNVFTQDESYKLAYEIIQKNNEKTLFWHYDSLKKNNIEISKNQVKRILQEIRELNFPKDEIFLQDISTIKISYSNQTKELKDLPFCFGSHIILNKEKNFRQEKFIIFTLIYQLKMFKDCKKFLWIVLIRYTQKNITNYTIS